MNLFFSKDYKPLPADWRPPSWISPELKLNSSDPSSLQKVASIFSKKFANSNTPLWCTVATGAIASLSYPWGFSQFLYGNTIGMIGGVVGCGILTATVHFIANGIWNQSRDLSDRDLNFVLEEARKNPLFEKIYASVVARAPVTLTATSVYSDISDASCSFHYENDHLVSHEILIYKKSSLKTALASLIFEFVNAYQWQRFKQVDDACEQGKLSQEEYAIATEYVEFNTGILANDILSYGVKNLSWPSSVNEYWLLNPIIWLAKKRGVHPFTLEWTLTNFIPIGGRESHTDSYRNDWKECKDVRTEKENIPAEIAKG